MTPREAALDLIRPYVLGAGGTGAFVRAWARWRGGVLVLSQTHWGIQPGGDVGDGEHVFDLRELVAAIQAEARGEARYVQESLL